MNQGWRVLFGAFLVCAISVDTSAAAAPEKPRLVVVISIDQLRFDYIERFSPWLTESGFKRFVREGGCSRMRAIGMR
jgi:predicted AlkP superfamily pyrophosphatase or phosphodiesterase